MGDFINAIPTLYGGIQFKSRMEAQCAFLLDKMEMDWIYEPQSFLLKNGISYLPDFLIDPDIILECRGYSNTKGDAQLAGFKREFAELGFSSYVVLSSDECTSYTDCTPGGLPARIGLCPKCATWRFCTDYSGHCSSCCCFLFRCFPLSFHEGKLRMLECIISELTPDAFSYGMQMNILKTIAADRIISNFDFAQQVLEILHRKCRKDEMEEVANGA